MKKVVFGRCLVLASLVFLSCCAAEGAAPEEFKKEFKLSQLSGEEMTLYAKRQNYLFPYIMCLAAAQNTPNMCQLLPPVEARLCRERLNTWHYFYRSVLLARSATPDLVQTCRRMFKPETEGDGSTDKSLSIDECQRGINGIISKKPSAECLANPVGCAAPIARDKAACAKDQDCIDSIDYLNAIEDNNPATCDNIQDESMRMLCKIGLSQEPEDCKQCATFQKFIDDYYDNSKAFTW